MLGSYHPILQAPKEIFVYQDQPGKEKIKASGIPPLAQQQE